MKDNLINLAKNFVGTRGFRNFYLQEKDILKDGDLSCAIFISTILSICRVVDGVSFTVKGLLFRIEKTGSFLKQKEPDLKDLQDGDIVVWEPLKEGGNAHVGIYIGDGMAISNRSSQGVPGRHPVIYTGLDKGGTPKKAKIKFLYRLKEN